MPNPNQLPAAKPAKIVNASTGSGGAVIWKRAPASATVSRIVTTKAVVAKMLQNTKRRASKKDVPTSAELANASVRFPKMVAIKAAARGGSRHPSDPPGRPPRKARPL